MSAIENARPETTDHDWNIAEVLTDLEKKFTTRMHRNPDVSDLWGVAQNVVYDLLDAHPNFTELTVEALQDKVQAELEICHANAYTRVAVERAREKSLSGMCTQEDIRKLRDNFYEPDPEDPQRKRFIMTDQTRHRLATDTIHDIVGQLEKPEKQIDHKAIGKLIEIHDALVPDDAYPLLAQTVDIYRATRSLQTKAGVTQAVLRPIKETADMFCRYPDALDEYTPEEQSLAVKMINYADSLQGSARIIHALGGMVQERQAEPAQNAAVPEKTLEKPVEKQDGTTHFPETAVSEDVQSVDKLIHSPGLRTSSAHFDPNGGIPGDKHGRVTFKKDGGKLRLVREHPIVTTMAMVSISGALVSTGQSFAAAAEATPEINVAAVSAYDATLTPSLPEDTTVIVTPQEPTSNVSAPAASTETAPASVTASVIDVPASQTTIDTAVQTATAAQAAEPDLHIDTEFTPAETNPATAPTAGYQDPAENIKSDIQFDATGDQAAVSGPKNFTPNADIAKAAIQAAQAFYTANATPEQLFEMQKNALRDQGYTEVNRPQFQGSVAYRVSTLDAIAGSVGLDASARQQYVDVTNQLFNVAHFPQLASTIDIKKLPGADQKYFQMAQGVYADASMFTGDDRSEYTDEQLNVMAALAASADYLVHPQAVQGAMVSTIETSQAPVNPVLEQNPNAPAPAAPPAQPAAPATPTPTPQNPEAKPMPSDHELDLQTAQAMINLGGDWANQGYVMQFMLTHTDFTPMQIAGIIGNMRQESGVRFDAIQHVGGNAKGICQWEGSRFTGLVNFANSRGKDWTDPETQLLWLLQELPSQRYGGQGPNTIEALKAAKTPEEAAYAFEHTFERAGNPVMASRNAGAVDVFNTFNKLKADVTAAAQKAATPAPAPAAPSPAPAPPAPAPSEAQPGTPVGAGILSAMKELDPYGYNSNAGHGRRTDYATVWAEIESGKMPVGAKILDCSAAYNAAVFKASGGKINLGTAATFDYAGNPHFQQIDPTQAQPGDAVVFQWNDNGEREGHVEAIDHYDPNTQTWYTFGSHSSYADDSKDISAGSFSAHGRYGVLESTAKVYRLVY